MKIIDDIKQALMIRHCPDYEKNMPEDKPGCFVAQAFIQYGYWGHKYRIVASQNVEGQVQAYKTARWLALKAQWKRPMWLFDCGICYAVNPADGEESNHSPMVTNPN